MESSDQNLYNILLEIKDQIGDLKATASELKSVTQSTLAQTLKTNGRVNHLEEDVEKLKEFQDTWRGKIAVIGICLGFIGTILAAWIKNKFGL